VYGVENVPADGGGLVVGNHSGTVALDALMLSVAIHDRTPAARDPHLPAGLGGRGRRRRRAHARRAQLTARRRI